MTRRLWLSIAVLALGASLLVAAGLAGPAGSKTPRSVSGVAKTGGTLNVELTTDIDYADPSLDYLSTGWEIQYATQVKLLNYPDKNGPAGSELVPEGATGFPKISKDGKTYTFTIKPGFRFSDGKPVTAANYAYAFNRAANPKMESPATPFLEDIVGASDVLAGKAETISGIKASGNTLVIQLNSPAPDLLARLAMPFFSAIPLDLPIDATGVDTPASAGPYYIASRTLNKQIIIKRNPNYKGPRPHNFDQIVYTIGNSLEAIRLNVESGKSDYAAAGIPPTAYAEVAQKYGINKGQFWVKPQLGVSYLAMNHDRPLFHTADGRGNVALKRAINFAVDRKALLAQSGYLAGKRTDQILPPGMAGFKDADLYPLKGPNFTFAQKLASGHTGDGKAVLYTSNRGAAPLRAQIYQFDLKQIGLDIEVKQFARAVQIKKEGTRGEPFDLTTEGWIADYADPFDFINVLLSGDSLHDANNNNVAYFNDPVFNKRMKQAALLTGSSRFSTYGQLDVDIFKDAAPWAAINNFNDRILVSSRVGCFTFNNVFSVDLAAICLK